MNKSFKIILSCLLVLSSFLTYMSVSAKPTKPSSPKPNKSQPKTCATVHAGKPQCSLQNGYNYSSKHQAMSAMGWTGFKTISPKPSTQGTCKGYSTHWNVRDPSRGSDRVGSIASCECCAENNGNPTMKTIYRAFR